MMEFGGRGLGMHGFAGGIAGGLFMFVFWIVLIILIAVGIRWLVTSTGTTPSNQGLSHERETAMDILNARYAKGEVDTAQFAERKKALSS